MPAAAFYAVWLGILTSISPCPLATNVAAISFIGKRLSRTTEVLLAGLTYALGRMLTYVAVGALVAWSILSVPGMSMFLQKHINRILGPVLIVAGMFLLELLRPNWSAPAPGRKLQDRAAKGGILGAGLLGILFALSFCPASAALFFGGLVPLIMRHNSLLLPALFGAGTALPVITFAFLIALGGRFVGSAFNRLRQFELWARRITGALFIVVGIHFSLRYIFRLY